VATMAWNEVVGIRRMVEAVLSRPLRQVEVAEIIVIPK
jgi:hypothetical protein